MDRNAENNQLDTVYIKELISRCEDIDELKENILPQMRNQKDEWGNKIREILAETGYSKEKFAKICGVTRQTLTNWCNGECIPDSREKFMRIGMTANYNVEKINVLLQRYGRFPGLYAKSLDDCACIFVTEHNYGEETVAKYEYILGNIKKSITKSDGNGSKNITTLKFNEKLSAVQDEDELEVFITENTTTFEKAYHKLYNYIKANLDANKEIYANYNKSVRYLATVQEWSSSLKQCVSAISQEKWYPTRDKIISLGLHLSMEHDQIDDMLVLAHMEKLCAKNIFESVIMFILDDASLNDKLNKDDEGYDPDYLIDKTRKILRELNMPEFEKFINELPEEEDDEVGE